MRGAVYALIDNTWDLTYATPFCAALKEESGYCTQTSGDYLKMFMGK